jgi:Uma2 family endonuclease
MTTVKKLTLEQFLALEETEPASEYACGEVYQKPMPTRKHGEMQTDLVMLLAQFLLQTRLGEALTAWRCIFGSPGDDTLDGGAVLPGCTVKLAELFSYLTLP